MLKKISNKLLNCDDTNIKSNYNGDNKNNGENINCNNITNGYHILTLLY